MIVTGRAPERVRDPVANALAIDPSLAACARERGHVRIAEHAFGAGVEEAVGVALARASVTA